MSHYALVQLSEGECRSDKCVSSIISTSPMSSDSFFVGDLDLTRLRDDMMPLREVEGF